MLEAKPLSWNANRGSVADELQWAWDGLVDIVPFWEGGGAAGRILGANNQALGSGASWLQTPQGGRGIDLDGTSNGHHKTGGQGYDRVLNGNDGSRFTILTVFIADTASGGARQTIWGNEERALEPWIEINGQGTGSFVLAIPGIWLAYTVESVIADDTLYVAFTRSIGVGTLTKTFWINGIEYTDQGSSNSKTTWSTSDKYFGRRADGSQMFNGKILLHHVWNYPLPIAGIQQLTPRIFDLIRIATRHVGFVAAAAAAYLPLDRAHTPQHQTLMAS